MKAAVWMLSVVLALLAAPSALAHTYRPNRTSDHTPNGCSLKRGKDCTLREAIISANHRPGHDTIVLVGGKTYRRQLPGTGEDAAKDGDLDITDSLKIKSSNHRFATVDAHIDSSSSPESVFQTLASTTLSRLRIKRGSFIAGGGIENGSSSLLVYRSRIQGNSAAFGAGISSNGPGRVVVSKSSVSFNHGFSFFGTGGGGINTDGPLTVVNSTISGNTVPSGFGPGAGGGIEATSTGVSITNSTIDGNRSTGQGAGIFNGGGTVSLHSVTIAHNKAGSGGGGYDNAGASAMLNSRNSLIALNTANGSPADCTATGTSFGHNLIGTDTGCTMFSTANGDFVNLSAAQIKLGALAMNGGPTRTDALLKGSRAIGHADSQSPALDQRGVKRTPHPDIGAFEFKP